MRGKSAGIVLVLLYLFFGASGQTQVDRQAPGTDVVRLVGREIALEFDVTLRSRVVATIGDQALRLGDFVESEQALKPSGTYGGFRLLAQKKEALSDSFGKGTRFILTARNDSLEKQVAVTFYDDFPALAVFDVQYTNTGAEVQQIAGWVNNRYAVDPLGQAASGTPPFWSYQPGSYESRPDWVRPLESGFQQENFLGMNATDYGGGTPVVDVWRKDVGLAVGHLEPTPELVSLPVSIAKNGQASVEVRAKVEKALKPGETIRTFRTFVSVHRGDFFQTLVDYRRFMDLNGVRFERPAPASYEPVWCAWGYERDFTVDQVKRTLPKVVELGYRWAVLDDGWQTSEGDWKLDPAKFPGGEADMARLVEQIHAQRLLARLWWAPLAVDPGTDLIKEHPEFLLLNADGSRQSISWWDAYYLCPAYAPVIDYTRQLVDKFIGKWGYDGLKIDGQHLNAAPPCYNPAHAHQTPAESFQKTPAFFKAIYERARAIKPDAVIEICPCGTAYSFFTMPFMSHGDASDPTSSWQIRHKAKTLKALMGPQAAYFGDHVELSDGGDDFASSFGVGAVIGTKFTWPVGSDKDSKIDLTPERERVWKKWQDLYRQKMLSRGNYLGQLYDIGFDRPEGHAIAKGDRLYYAFYAKEWSGTVVLRGLTSKNYRIVDYVNARDFGVVTGPEAKLDVRFTGSLLLEASPE
ncbi:MAG: glycosyl hydrolase [Acidobacteria bacterium]|nr:MAG: glycosyl hydrolase [Acidobacteriota bacterium]